MDSSRILEEAAGAGADADAIYSKLTDAGFDEAFIGRLTVLLSAALMLKYEARLWTGINEMFGAGLDHAAGMLVDAIKDAFKEQNAEDIFTELFGL